MRSSLTGFSTRAHTPYNLFTFLSSSLRIALSSLSLHFHARFFTSSHPSLFPPLPSYLARSLLSPHSLTPHASVASLASLARSARLARSALSIPPTLATPSVLLPLATLATLHSPRSLRLPLSLVSLAPTFHLSSFRSLARHLPLALILLSTIYLSPTLSFLALHSSVAPLAFRPARAFSFLPSPLSLFIFFPLPFLISPSSPSLYPSTHSSHSFTLSIILFHSFSLLSPHSFLSFSFSSLFLSISLIHSSPPPLSSKISLILSPNPLSVSSSALPHLSRTCSHDSTSP